jgi:uncharacterized protein YdaU (DUF1376 family)
MAEFPALPVFTDAYIADTIHLTTLEHGAYFLLLTAAWRRPHCDLPDDDQFLSRIARLSLDDWIAIRSTIMEFWNFDGRRKTWTQKRLSKERSYVSNKSRSQKDKAAKRWNNEKKEDAAALPEDMPERCPDDAPTPTPFTLPNGNGGEPPNLTEQLWSNGLAVVIGFGVAEAKARPLLGKWRKAGGDAGVLALLAQAQREEVSDLVPWMEAAVKGRAPYRRETEDERQKRERAEWVERNYGPNSPRALQDAAK